MTGVYCILCLANRKIYIGQSKNAKQRYHKHKYNLRHKTHHSKSLQKAWDKYGSKMFFFFMIEECKEEDLLKREQYWIDKLRPFDPKIGFNRDKFREASS